jgi:outer membrane protein assembly factor BamD (BamD/ComL family)
MLGMYEEAKAQFEEVLRQDPTNEVALKQIQFLQF